MSNRDGGNSDGVVNDNSDTEKETDNDERDIQEEAGSDDGD